LHTGSAVERQPCPGPLNDPPSTRPTSA
jgi:hypothetical protein